LLTKPAEARQDGFSMTVSLDTFDGNRLLTTLQRLLLITAPQLRPALDQASTLTSEALGAEKVEVFLYEAASTTLVSLGTSATPLGRRQRELGLGP
jgi:hypothetical protein